MPVPSSIDDLSTTAGSNSPSGSETPTEGDNYIRTLSAFIATLRDKLDGTSDTGTIKNATFSGTTSGLRVPLVAYKTATTSRTSTITVTDDPHLSVALTAGTYKLEMWLPFWCTTVSTPGIRWQFSYTGTTATPSHYSYDGAISAAATQSAVAPLTQLQSHGGRVATDHTAADVIQLVGVITASTSGTLKLGWAQQTSNSSATNIGSGAWIVCTPLS